MNTEKPDRRLFLHLDFESLIRGEGAISRENSVKGCRSSMVDES